VYVKGTTDPAMIRGMSAALLLFWPVILLIGGGVMFGDWVVESDGVKKIGRALAPSSWVKPLVNRRMQAEEALNVMSNPGGTPPKAETQTIPAWYRQWKQRSSTNSAPAP
jgi:hypothetical protein